MDPAMMPLIVPAGFKLKLPLLQTRMRQRTRAGRDLELNVSTERGGKDGIISFQVSV